MLSDQQGELSSAEITGERKRITMMFADVVGSTELLANVDTEQGTRLLVAVVGQMIAAVEEFGGIVNQVSGDGIMALFGAPVSFEDHAARGCHAALRMQNVIHGQAFPEACGRAVRIRIGIHSGEVIATERGHGFDHQYTAFGQAAHIAARLEQAARPARILISESTYVLVAAWVDAKLVGPTPLKGLDEPITAYELLRAKAHRRDFRTKQLDTPFIGRKALMATLRGTATKALSGCGRAVLIVGEPGIGKSRLCHEMLTQIGSDWRILQSGGISFIRPTPYQAVLEWLQGFWKTRADDVEESVWEWLDSLGHPALIHAPAILALAGVDHKDKRWAVLPPIERRSRTVKGITEILALEASRRPLALLVEDLQWVDEATIEVICLLIQTIDQTPIVLLANGRKGEIPAPIVKTNIMEIELDNFSQEETSKFVEALVGRDTCFDNLIRQLFEHTAGNAFFIEETVKSIKGSRHSIRMKDLSAAAIPDTIQGLIAMRIDHLSVAAKSALQAAAVLGTNFNARQITSLAGLGDGQEHVIGQLLETGFLLQRAAAVGIQLEFRHALGREVSYAGLLSTNRKRLHSLALRLLEQLGDIEASVLAYHAGRGELWERKHHYSLLAGEISLTRSAPQEALSFFNEALESLFKRTGNDERQRAELKLRFTIRNTLFSLGRAREIGPHLAIAEDLARRVGDNYSLARALSLRSHHSWLMAQWNDAITAGGTALKMSDEIGDVGLKATTLFFMGLAHYSLGAYGMAVDLFARNTEILTGDLAHERFGSVAVCSVVSNSFLAISLLELGRFDEAYDAAMRAEFLANEAGGPFDRVQADLAVAAIDLARGRAGRVIPLLEQTLEACRSSMAVLIPRTMTALALAYALDGRVGDVIRLSAQDEASGETINPIKSMTLRMMGEALLVARQIPGADERADTLVQHSRATGQPGAEAWGLYLLAVIRASRHLFDEAEELARMSVSLAKPRQMVPLLARCQLLHAEIAHGLAKPNADYLRELARSYCREVGLEPSITGTLFFGRDRGNRLN